MGLPSIDLNRFPETRPQVDVESIVMELFTRGFSKDGDAPDWAASFMDTTGADGETHRKVLVFNEIDVDVDAYAQAADVVVFHCEPPVFAGRRHRSHMWECSMSVLVESVDADRAFLLASYVRQLIMCWPLMAGTQWGQVAKVTMPPSFAKAAGGKQATSKRIKQYATASICEFHVRDTFS